MYASLNVREGLAKCSQKSEADDGRSKQYTTIVRFAT